MSRNWIAVASAEHVRIGRSKGFMQVCHGKAAPLGRIQPGDGVVYYSPTSVFRIGDQLQSFTAIGSSATAIPIRQTWEASHRFAATSIGARPRKHRSNPCSAGSNSRRRNATGAFSCVLDCSKFPGRHGCDRSRHGSVAVTGVTATSSPTNAPRCSAHMPLPVLPERLAQGSLENLAGS